VVLSRGATPDAVGAAIAGGAQLVKLKVTPDAADLDAVVAARAEHPGAALAVDFNGTATVEALRALEGLMLRYVEQPAPADALVVSAHLAAATDAPIALDESVTSAHSLDAAVALGAGAVLNVKPARCGGPHVAASLVRRAREAGMEVFVGGMLESGVGRAGALAVAALEGCTLPTDLGPSSAYFAEDLTEPLACDGDGRILVPDGPGIGRVPDPDRLAAVTVAHHRALR
jgi:O-succinylbenzoate synthase